MMNGWIKLHRKLLENPVVMKDADHLAVWVYLLLEATHEDYPTLWGGKKIILKPGQVIKGRLQIARDLNINESKVKRIINLLKSDQQIDQQAKRYGSLITILNWDKYQERDQQNDQRATNERPTSDQRVTSKQEDKEHKNNKNNIYKRFSPPTIEEVRAYCNERGNNVDPEKFIDFYESKGWMVGKTKMKDWRAAVRNWERNSASKSSKNNLNDFYEMSREWAQEG